MLGQPLHRARFASHWEIRPLLSPSLPIDGVLLGTERFMLGRQFVTVRRTNQHPELGHVLIVCRTRGGKGLLAESQLNTWQHSVVVNDIKGDLFTRTAGFRSLLGPVYVLDPTGIGHAYDPLAGKTSEDDLNASATQLLHQAELDIFTLRAMKMLACIFMAAVRNQAPVLPYARMLLRAGVDGCVAQLHATDPALTPIFLGVTEQTPDRNDRFLSSAWETLTSKMFPIMTETVIRTLARSDFTPEEIITSPRPVTVYLRWPEKRLLALAPLVRLLWSSLIDEMSDVYDQRGGEGCYPVLLLIDEAGRAPIPSLADHATTAAGRHISIWLAVQSLSQLVSTYGKVRAQVIRDNMDTQLFYRPPDLTTASYIEARLGRRSAFAHTTTEQHGGKTSESQSEQAIPLLSAQDFLRYKDHEVIGFHWALPPFKLARMDWRQHPVLQKRRTIPAPTLPILTPLDDLPVLQTTLQREFVDPDG